MEAIGILKAYLIAGMIVAIVSIITVNFFPPKDLKDDNEEIRQMKMAFGHPVYMPAIAIILTLFWCPIFLWAMLLPEESD